MGQAEGGQEGKCREEAQGLTQATDVSCGEGDREERRSLEVGGISHYRSKRSESLIFWHKLEFATHTLHS